MFYFFCSVVVVDEFTRRLYEMHLQVKTEGNTKVSDNKQG